jgi:hypothetical protein
MSLLGDLEQEARAARERRASASAARAQRTTSAESRLRPALERAERYLERFAAQLVDIDREIRVDYSIPDLGHLQDLTQRGYRVTRDGEHGVSAARLSMTCSGTTRLEVALDGDAAAKVHARALKAAGLECRLSPEGPRRVLIRVEPRVPVSVSLSPDLEREAVVLEMRNLLGIGVQTYRIDPDRVDEVLLEAVARCVLREPSDLARLTGSVVDDAQRASMRKHLDREQRRRDAELAGGLRRTLFPVAEWFRRTVLRR